MRAGTGDRLVHRLEDVHLRGLLTILGDADRIRAFVTHDDPDIRVSLHVALLANEVVR